jgi:hypothetical protein
MQKFAQYACGVLMAATVNVQLGHAAFRSLIPSSTGVSTGTNVDADVAISGLQIRAPPSVGAFDLEESFNASVLSVRNLSVRNSWSQNNKYCDAPFLFGMLS